MLKNFIPILLHNSIYIKIKNTFIQSKKQNESLSKLMKLVNISLNYCFFYFLDILELALCLSKPNKTQKSPRSLEWLLLRLKILLKLKILLRLKIL